MGLVAWSGSVRAAEPAPAGPAEEDALEHKVLTGSLDAGVFADRQADQDVVSISPLLQMGMRARPEVELGIRFGAAMMFADSVDEGEVRVVRPSNLMFGTRWVRDALDDAHHGHIGFAFALPTNFRLDDREVEALDYAIGVRGGLDPWQWAPTTLGIVVPGGWSWRGKWVQVGADGALAALIAASSNPDRPGFAAQLRGHVALASPWVLAGAALSGVVNTRDKRDVTQAAVGPFIDVPMCFGKRRRPTCPLAITGQATVNLDAPYGFAGDGLRVWGAQAGIRWSLFEPA
jgi:hypothetical protein